MLNKNRLEKFYVIAAIVFSILTLFQCGNSFASDYLANKNYLISFLNRFQQNSRKALDEPPKKSTKEGEMELIAPAANQSIDNSALTFEEHDHLRMAIAGGHQSGMQNILAPFLGNDRAEVLIDGTIIRKLSAIEDYGLLSGHAATNPWGDSYWPIVKGGVSNRYADANAPKDTDWLLNMGYVQSHPAANIVSSRNWMNIDNLSPAEKYDIIVGDRDFGLSKWAWQQGQKYVEDRGYVPSWMGICHGWAIASYLTSTPETFVDVPSADNSLQIRFYLSDMKALMSSLWARAMPRTKFIGGRCRTRNPERDSAGRIRDPKCFDVNPGTWHLVITNQLGQNRKGFIMDTTFDYEVWNQPVVSYSYSYFNPQTHQGSASLSQALIAKDQFTRDKFRNYRPANTNQIVGINMQVTYAVEMIPSHNHKNSRPPMRTVNYVYDLELDANEQIIGGEWYQNAHPDFLWSIAEGTVPITTGEELIPANDSWYGYSPLSSSWLNAVRAASAKGQPLSQIVYALFARARNNHNQQNN